MRVRIAHKSFTYNITMKLMLPTLHKQQTSTCLQHVESLIHHKSISYEQWGSMLALNEIQMHIPQCAYRAIFRFRILIVVLSYFTSFNTVVHQELLLLGNTTLLACKMLIFNNI